MNSTGPTRRTQPRMRENDRTTRGPFLVTHPRARDTMVTSEDDGATPSRSEALAARRKRSHPPHVPASAVAGSSTSRTMELATERAQKTPTQKSRHSNKPLPAAPEPARSKIKKELPPREVKRLLNPRLPPPTTASEVETDVPHSYNGPIAVAEFARLKKEVEVLKRQIVIKDKTIEKHSATISELRRELSAATQSRKEHKSQLDKLTAKSKRSIELVANIESTLQCHICMDTLVKPFALGPCGHVLCQGCLQDWFRQAPVDPDDMDTDGSIPLVHRKKTCPVCRTRVRSRPLPLFVLKSLLSTLDKAKSAGPARPSPALETDDPWAGIFHSPLDDLTDDYDEDEVGDYDEEEEFSDEEGGVLDDYDNTSDDEYEGEWDEPCWEPPLFRQVIPLHVEPYMDNMLRRGATTDMIELYDMEYTHEGGLYAYSHGYTFRLGWNVDLAEDDDSGERFVAWCLEDVQERPERWLIEEAAGAVVATKLVRADEADSEYANTETDVWIGEDEDEDYED